MEENAKMKDRVDVMLDSCSLKGELLRDLFDRFDYKEKLFEEYFKNHREA